jgi:PAS domain S-box-containing protein
VVSATNGLEGMKVVESENVHLIISDAMMPKMDGFQFCKTIKHDPRTTHIPFIIYTSDYIDQEDKDLAHTIGVDRYVVKIGGTDSLIDTVKELIEKHYNAVAKEQRDTPETAPPVDDIEFIERHDKILIKKLEEKMLSMEEYSLQLLRKNDELQRSEIRYRLLFERASIPIFVMDYQGEHLLDMNSEAIRLLGYSREELLALQKLPIADSDIQSELVITQSFTGEVTVRSKDGKIICLEATASVIDFDKEKRILLFARDVTEQKAMLEKIFHTEKLSLLGTIAAGIAHEVRNPLAGVKLNLQYLEQKYGEQHPDIETLQLAIEGTRHIEKVIENTLNIARSTAPDIRFASINEVVTQSINLLMLTIHKKNIELETHLMQVLPSLKIDAKQVMQVVLNVLKNAVEATPPNGSIRVSTGFEFPGRTDSSRLLVSIKDSGPGFDGEYLKQAFELFKTTKNNGTGLGLALSKRIMNQHNGELRIVPVPDGGTDVQLLFLINTTEQEKP